MISVMQRTRLAAVPRLEVHAAKAPPVSSQIRKRTRVQLYLPIADIPVNVLLILAMGAAVGFVSGMFGIGGGFLMTPLLIFVGIAPAVAVATVTSHIAASSFSGALSYWRKRAIDPMLALVLLSGGIIGTILGVLTFTRLRSLGQLDLLIALSYLVLLSGVGAAMSWEGLRAMLRARQSRTVPLRRSGGHGWVHGLPLKIRFKRSKIYLSAIPVIAIGLLIGFIGAVMGIGGGFILVPLLIYLLRVPTSTVIGTSMMLTLITMTFATVLHAATNHLVDAVLALILMTGGVTGAQFGARAGQRIRGEHLRLLLGLLILAVGIRFAIELGIRPADLYTVRETTGDT
ncbi:putative membrane protein YfcA [Nitrobacter sp. TKz-YC01]